MSLTVTPRTRRDKAMNLHNCWAGCTSGGIGGGASLLRPATHYAWILGYRTPLCKRCADGWVTVWESACRRPENPVALEVPGA